MACCNPVLAALRQTGRLATTALLLISATWLPSRGQEKNAPPPAGRDGIVICAYNLKNWLSMDRFDGKSKVLPMAPKPIEEKAAVMQIIHAINPDILGVCEMGSEDDLKDFAKQLKDKGLALDHIERAHGGDTTRSLALLSRFPIVARNSQASLQYKIGGTVFPMQRGILDATVRIADGLEIRMVGIHLKSKREVPEADQALMRRNEAHLLRKHLDGIVQASPGGKIVLYGDFNEHRNEPAIREIMSSRSDPARMNEVKIWDFDGEVWTHFWDAADVYSRFDYFFVSDAVWPLLDFKKSFVYSKRAFHEASDHRPIVITIKPGK